MKLISLFLVLIFILIASPRAANFGANNHYFGNALDSDPVTIYFKDGGYIKKSNEGALLFSINGASEDQVSTGVTNTAKDKNVLVNSGFETGATGWTNSGGTVTISDFTYGYSGDSKYLNFVATGSGQYFLQTIDDWPSNMPGDCFAFIEFIDGDSAFEVKVIEDFGGSPTEHSSVSLGDGASWDRTEPLVFTCPSAGESITLQVISTGAGEVSVNNTYVGSTKALSPGAEFYRVSTRIKHGEEHGVCHIDNSSGTPTFNSSDQSCWFVSSVSSNGTGISRVTLISSGFRCTFAVLEAERDIGVRNTAGGEVETETFAAAFDVFTNISFSGANDDVPFILSCWLPKGS